RVLPYTTHFRSSLAAIGWQLYRTPNGSQFSATVVTETLDQRVPSIEPGNSKLAVFPEYGLDEIKNENLSERIQINKTGTKTFFVGSEKIGRASCRERVKMDDVAAL